MINDKIICEAFFISSSHLTSHLNLPSHDLTISSHLPSNHLGMMLGGSVERETLVDFENVIVVAEISLVKELGEI